MASEQQERASLTPLLQSTSGVVLDFAILFPAAALLRVETLQPFVCTSTAVDEPKRSSQSR